MDQHDRLYHPRVDFWELSRVYDRRRFYVALHFRVRRGEAELRSISWHGSSWCEYCGDGSKSHPGLVGNSCLIGRVWNDARGRGLGHGLVPTPLCIEGEWLDGRFSFRWVRRTETDSHSQTRHDSFRVE